MAGDKAALTARFTVRCGHHACSLCSPLHCTFAPTQALSTCTRIFYCLNYIELPQFFLDNLGTWVSMFQTFLSYSNAVLEDPDETDVAGPVETLQTHIMAALALYAEKFDEDVEEHLPVFVDSTVRFLCQTGAPRRRPTHALAFTFAVEAVASGQHWKCSESPQV